MHGTSAFRLQYLSGIINKFHPIPSTGIGLQIIGCATCGFEPFGRRFADPFQQFVFISVLCQAK